MIGIHISKNILNITQHNQTPISNLLYTLIINLFILISIRNW